MIAVTESLRNRTQFGRNLRRKLKRSGQSFWKASQRKHDPLEIILACNRERISELVPIKMARMVVSPFGYFRGNVPVMAADLATLPRTGIEVQICGDAHVRNLGAFAALDGRMIFDLNDFDETARGPWEWDVKRLVTSLVLAGRQARHSESSCREAVLTCVETYRLKMTEFSSMTRLELTKYRIHRQFLCKPGAFVLQRAERATPDHNLAKLTTGRGKSVAFKQNRPVMVPLAKATEAKVLRSLAQYRATLSPPSQLLLSFYRPVAVAFKIVGTGSVATHDYVVLHLSGEGAADPLFLQVKQALPSAYAPYLRSAKAPMNQGERVVRGQRMLQFQPDLLLGWCSFDGADYLVRQLNDHKGSIEDEDLAGNGLIEYAVMCGEVLARGHARSGDPAVLAGYIGNSGRLDRALVKFAVEYADQTTSDYENFKKAIRTGKIKASKPYL